MLSGSPSTSIQILVDYPPTVCALYQALSPLIGIQSCFFLAAFTITSIAGFQCHAIQNISK